MAVPPCVHGRQGRQGRNRPGGIGGGKHDPKQKIDFGNKFWEHINTIPYFGEEGCKSKSIIGQSVTIKALAKIAYDLGYNTKNKNEEALTKLFRQMKSIDFGHNNQVWQYYNLDDKIRRDKFQGLEKYLPPVDDSNRDMGLHDGKFMRFGSKHNDISPLIGDIIRWYLKLPSRNQSKHEAVENAA